MLRDERHDVGGIRKGREEQEGMGRIKRTSPSPLPFFRIKS
jgi:hypothetical protein